MDNINMDWTIRNSVESHPAEKGEIGNSIEKPKKFNASEAANETNGLVASAQDGSLKVFIDAFRENVLAKKVEGIFASFADKLKSEAGNFEEFQKFYSSSEVLAHIISMSLDLVKYDDVHAEYTGIVITDQKKEYPTILKVQKGDGNWKISEIGFSPV